MLYHHPVAGEPIDGAGSEGHRALLSLIGQQFFAGQAGSIVDGNGHLLPAKTAAGGASISLADAIAGDAMANIVDAAQLFDFDVHPFSRLLTFVADDRRPRIQGR